MGCSLKYYRWRLDNPRYLEPPIGRRKARIECYGPNCATPVIETRWLCKECWKKLPRFYRRGLQMLYRKWKFYRQEGLAEAREDTAERWPPVAARCLKWLYEHD